MGQKFDRVWRDSLNYKVSTRLREGVLAHYGRGSEFTQPNISLSYYMLSLTTVSTWKNHGLDEISSGKEGVTFLNTRSMVYKKHREIWSSPVS